jgi:glutathione reductase (NADPH)
MPEFDFDFFVIGAGSGGVAAARTAGACGRKVAIAEERRIGGTCVLRGCVPKKLLVYGTSFADSFADAAAYGWTVGEPILDWGRLIRAKDEELDRLEGVYRRLLRDSHVEVLEGRGRLVEPHVVEVGDRRYTAKHVLVAVGGWPALPQLPGIEHAITSNEALELELLPKRISIVGGGYVALEFASIFNAAGVEVQLLVRSDSILRGFDRDVRAALRHELELRGIDVCSETVVESVEKTSRGYSLRFQDRQLVETDLVMYATGRTPNTKDLGLERVGVQTNRGGTIRVDEWSKTNVDGIYAIGDVTDRINLTPLAIAEGRALVQTLFRDNPTPIEHQSVATAVFSQPPVAAVGMTEAQAREACDHVDVYRVKFRPMKHTLTGAASRTMMKLVVDRDTDRVMGCHMVGDDAPEIIQGLAVAIKCGATKKQFDATIGIHPTSAEEFVTMREPVASER